MQNCHQLLVTNIQRMCFHDGPGIRTTVFTKGCNLHCPWCSNPENISFEIEAYQMDGMRGVYGRKYDATEFVGLLMRDKNFWSNNGGVTFSGGEALMQTEALIPILKKLKEFHIHIAMETALFVSEDQLKKVLPYIDYFIVDIKILDQLICKKVLGGDLCLYKNNVEILYRSGKLKQFRFPCCLEYTFSDKNKMLFEEYLKNYLDIPVQIFAIHKLGREKYRSLNRVMWETQGIKKIYLNDYCKKLNKNGINAEIIEI